MADGIAIAIDKVGEPAPSAPEAKAGAPTVDTSGALNSPVKEDHHHEPAKPAQIPDGAGPAVSAPKPVEIKSVPETPVNGATPAGGTPRPELKILDEPTAAKDSAKDTAGTSGIAEPLPTPTASIPDSDAAPASAAVNGERKAAAPATHAGPETEPVPATAPAPASVAESSAASAPTARLTSPPTGTSATNAPTAAMEPVAGDKRKLGEGSGDDGDATRPATDAGSESPMKKAKVDDEASTKVNGDAPAADDPPARKPGRPKKDKSAAGATAAAGAAAAAAAAPAGRTARKTRSQGPAEV